MYNVKSYIFLKKKNKTWGVTIFSGNKSTTCVGFKTAHEAEIVADWISYSKYNVFPFLNFSELTVDELNKKHKEILNVYGYDRIDKISRKEQGVAKIIEKSSKYVGVTRLNDRKSGKNWASGITCRRKFYPLGKFYNETNAAIAYDLKAVELYGINAKLNFEENRFKYLSNSEYFLGIIKEKRLQKPKKFRVNMYKKFVAYIPADVATKYKNIRNLIKAWCLEDYNIHLNSVEDIDSLNKSLKDEGLYLNISEWLKFKLNYLESGKS